MAVKSAVLLAEGLEETEAVTVIDLLRRAEFDVQTRSLNDALWVRGSHGIEIKADRALKGEENDFDLVVLPGGMPGTTHLTESVAARELVTQMSLEGKWLAAICAAPTALATWGLLEGKKATCYPTFANKMTGATLVEEPVVVSGKIITSRGVGTAIDFSLKIIEQIRGRELAEKISRGIVYR